MIKITRKERVGVIFTVQKFNSKGEITYQGKPFHNLVLNCGLDLLATMSLYFATDTCNVGTGTTAPAVTDTGLETRFASSSTLYGTVSYDGTASDPMSIGVTRVFEFAIGVFSGQPLSEVGLSAGSNSNYFNRQLIKDEYGSPTTITVLVDEGVRITAESRCYCDMQIADSPETGSFLIGGVTYNYERTVNSYAYTELSTNFNKIYRQHFGNITGFLASSTGLTDLKSEQPDYRSTSTTYNTYTPGDFAREATCIFPASVFNGTIKYIGVGYTGASGVYRAESIFTLTGDTETPAVLLEKTNLQELTLVFKREWAAH